LGTPRTGALPLDLTKGIPSRELLTWRATFKNAPPRLAKKLNS